MAILVASIDFGTTFSSWAYSFKHDFQQEPTKIIARTWNSGTNISQKAPTALLIKPDGKTLDTFGYEAESKYAELAAEGEHKSWYFFRRFKMQLFKNKAVRKDLSIDDETGKPLDAITLFGLAIEFLKNDMMKNSGEKVAGQIEEDDIKWVITVPAIWTEKSKQFMREAAKKAGIPNDRLVLALEPEAVSIYCRHLPVQKATAGSTSISAFKPGTCYLICDAGGGTIDITIHEVLEGFKLREVEKASGGDWGGTKVDQAFEKLLAELAGEDVFSVWTGNHTDDYLELMRRFEIKKRALSKETSKVVLSLPMSLNEIVKLKRHMTLKEAIAKSKYAKDIVQEMDKLKVDAKIMRSLFAESIDKAVAHVRKLLHTYSQVSHILLAGGFSESQLFQDAMQHNFSGKTLIVPSDAGLAVLKGAVIHGHNTTIISSRKAKFAYGVGFYAKYDPTLHTPGRHIKIGKHKGYVAGCFDSLIEMDQDLQQDGISAIKSYEPFPGDLYVIVELFCCDSNSPMYVDEPGCFKLGKVTVDCPARDDLVTVSLFLGGTELKVSAVNSVGKEVSATFDLPD